MCVVRASLRYTNDGGLPLSDINKRNKQKERSGNTNRRNTVSLDHREEIVVVDMVMLVLRKVIPGNF